MSISFLQDNVRYLAVPIRSSHVFNSRQPRVVRLGEYDFNDDFDGAAHQDFNVAKTVFHPDFLHSQAYYDLILVKLDSSVTFQVRNKLGELMINTEI